MVERLSDIVTQIRNVHQLGAVVTAMRGIAASRTQQSRSLLAGIDTYANVIARAIGQALSLLPPDGQSSPAPRGAKRGVILFCAEQGFAGAFSERVLDAAAGDLAVATSFITGTRGVTLANERGLRPAWSRAMATHVGAIPSFANDLADALYHHVAADAVLRVDMLFPRSEPGGNMAIERRSLLPLDFGRFVQPVADRPPLITLAPPLLLERLAAEYVYAQLCEAAMHSFAAENEARMIAMAAAKTNIETKLTELMQHERRLRQQEITTEIIELAAGTEAMTDSR
jgi:F-type H+-transporting ATPase subunit gamma